MSINLLKDFEEIAANHTDDIYFRLNINQDDNSNGDKYKNSNKSDSENNQNYVDDLLNQNGDS